MKEKVFRKRTIKAKRNDEVTNSFLFQAEKLLAKTVKSLKVDVSRKILRKVSSHKSEIGEENESNMDRELATTKKSDHKEVAQLFLQQYFADKLHDIAPPQPSNESMHLFKIIAGHKKIAEVIAALQSKLSSMQKKNNELRAVEQRALAKVQKTKTLLAKRIIGKVCMCSVVISFIVYLISILFF
jgi:hypothetical protein